MLHVRLLLVLAFATVLSGCAIFGPESESELTIYGYDEVTTKPVPIGGFAAMGADARYPEIANRASVVGSVLVHLTVSETGELSDIGGRPNPFLVQGIGA